MNNLQGKYRFSIVELLLAFAVLVIVFNGFVALFSSGLDSSQKAIQKSSATESVEYFLKFFSNKIKNDWTWVQAFPDTKSDWTDTWVGWSNNPVLDKGNVKIDFIADDLNATFSPSTNQDGLFRVQYISNNNQADFSAVMRVWKNEEVAGSKVTLYCEVSWPADIPYDQRKKETFSSDVFKTPEIALGTNEKSGGVVTKTDDNGVTIELTDVIAGSRIIEFKITNTEASNGSLTSMVVSCNLNDLTEHSASENWATSEGYDATTGINGLIIDGSGGTVLAKGEAFTFTYTLDPDSVPETTIATVVGGNVATLVFAVDDFDYVFNYEKEITSTITFTKSATAIAETSSVSTDIAIQLFVPAGESSTEDITVDVSAIQSSTADYNNDYSTSLNSVTNNSSTAIITFSAGSASGSIVNLSFTVIQDSNVEGDEYVDLQLNVTDGSAKNGLLTDHKITITDDDIGLLSFKVGSSNTIDETATTAHDVVIELTIADSGILEKDVSIQIKDLLSGTAGSNVDYTFPSSSESVTFAKDSVSGTTQTIGLNVLEDLDIEGDETVVLQLVLVDSVSTALGAQSNHTVTITDDDMFSKDGVMVKFGCDYVDIQNTNNTPVQQVALKYFGENSFSAAQSVTISKDESVTLNAESGQKIEEVNVTASNTDSDWLTFTTTSDCGITTNSKYMVVFECDTISVKNLNTNKSIKQVKFWYYGKSNWEMPKSVSITNSMGFTNVSADAGNVIEKVRLSRSTSNKGWTTFTNNQNCDAFIVENNLEDSCEDVATGNVLQKGNCDMVFDIDYVNLKNKKNYPITEIKFKYLNNTNWDPNFSVDIPKKDTYTKVKGVIGEKIKAVSFTRNGKWYNKDSDASLCQ